MKKIELSDCLWRIKALMDQQLASGQTVAGAEYAIIHGRYHQFTVIDLLQNKIPNEPWDGEPWPAHKGEITIRSILDITGEPHLDAWFIIALPAERNPVFASKLEMQ